ncbi:SatD family protein [Clostridium thailandense]|uniref:SatD family protein n=1 Tax=Clostridium thailandense TaxID=2794346 RepID=UPI003989CB72
MGVFAVVNIDIAGSRKLKDRKVLQEDLRAYIQKLNLELKDILLTPMRITLGDEWQVVLKEPNKSYYIINRFQSHLRKKNISIYAGIGMGDISTNVYDNTTSMDGECFIKAREALNVSKNKNRYYNRELNSKKNNIYFNAEEISFENEFMKKASMFSEVAFTTSCEKEYDLSINKVINTIIENNEVLKDKITDKQLEIIELYEEFGSYNNIIKQRAEISKADISQKLNVSNYFVINNNNFIIENLIASYCRMRKGS